MVSALTASARKITMTFARRATRRLLSTLPPGNSANNFRAKLASRPCTMQFNIIPSPVVTQMMASAGADVVCIDMEHGPIDFKDAQAMIMATQGTATLPAVRVPSIEPMSVKRALDSGAEGIVFPLARSAADVARAVGTMRYPPEGERGFGPFIASSCHGFEMTEAVKHYAMNPPVCIVLIETVEAVEQIAEIVRVGGVDAFQIAQYDLTTALGISGQFDHPRFLEAEAAVEAAVLGAGKPLGAVALTEARARELRSRGYRLLVGFDVHWLKSAVAAKQSWAQS